MKQAFYVQSCLPESHAVEEIMCSSTKVEPQMSQMTVRRMRFACWIRKATDTRSEYVLLVAFPRQ